MSVIFPRPLGKPPKAAKGMIARLTKRTVDAAQAMPREYAVWDDLLHGFGLRVKPSGAKSYCVQYKIGGKHYRYGIAQHGVFTPDQARVEAVRLLREVKLGRNPAIQRKAERAGDTMEELCVRYLDAYAKPHKRPASVRADRLIVEKHVLPAMGARLVSDVGRADVAKLHHSLAGTPYAANRTVALLSKLFNLAEVWGLRKDATNPCRHVERYKEHKRRRYLNAAELGRLGDALREAERARTELPAVIAAIRLLLFTGCRLSEVLTLKWEHVSLERGVLTLPTSKTGAKDVVLNPGSLEVLAGVERVAGNPYVLPGAKPGAHLVNLEKPWRRLRTRAGIEDVRLHDLRHTHASVAAGLGASMLLIGGLLGHANQATTARYAHLQTDPLREVSDAVSARLKASLNATEANPADVVDIATGRPRGEAGT